jgi:hypothetical protein
VTQVVNDRAASLAQDCCSALNQLPDRNPNCFTSLTRLIPGGQLGTEQARVGAFVSEPTPGCKLLVDGGGGGQVPRFHVRTIVNDDEAIEGQPRLGTVASNELIDGVLVNTARRR